MGFEPWTFGVQVRVVEYSTTRPADVVAVIVNDEGLLTVTPATDFVGTAVVAVAVRPGPDVIGNSSADVA